MDDWDKPTILRKSRPTAKDARSASAVNKAMASGNVEVSKKFSAGTNKHSGTDVNLAKIDQQTEVGKVPTVSLEVSRAIQAGRQQLGITQKELATRISEKQQVVHDYEAGKAIPSQQILGKLERALQVRLRGSNIGQPLSK